MARRKKICPATEATVLTASGRRCCVCYALLGDLSVKKGQIAHLDHDASNADIQNLAFLCMDHHDEHDSRRSQSKGFTVEEIKEYRSRLHIQIGARQAVPGPPPSADAPLLAFWRAVPPTAGIPNPGIQLIDSDPHLSPTAGQLLLSVHYKTSRYFGLLPPLGEKWLYLEATIRPALNVRIHVRAWNPRDVSAVMDFLYGKSNAYDLHGPRSETDSPGDFFYLWREGTDNRLMIAVFSPTSATTSVHARVTEKALAALAAYLETTGFVEWHHDASRPEDG